MEKIAIRGYTLDLKSSTLIDDANQILGKVDAHKISKIELQEQINESKHIAAYRAGFNAYISGNRWNPYTTKNRYAELNEAEILREQRWDEGYFDARALDAFK